MKIVGTIEARMGSRRYPGKTLTPVYKTHPLLECVVTRLSLARCVDQVVVATSTAPADDAIEEWCRTHDVTCHRGSEDDLLDRIAGAITVSKADAIVQMGADSAYLDFQLVDELVDLYTRGSYDYVCNDMELTYPLGIYGHIVRADVLVELNRRNDLSTAEREGVVPYIYEHPDRYALCTVKAPEDFYAPQMRLTVDYAEDMELARRIYAHFDRFDFTTRDLIDLYKREPVLFEQTKFLKQESAPFLKKTET